MKRFLVTLLMMPALSATSFAAEISILSASGNPTSAESSEETTAAKPRGMSAGTTLIFMECEIR